MPADASSGIKIDVARHVSGLGANLDKLSDGQRAAVRSLERALRTNKAALASQDYITDSVLVKFLIARDWDEEKAVKMVNSALEWRLKRPCHRWVLAAPPAASGLAPAVPPDLKHARTLEASASTGKIRVPGCDRFGRPVMVLDNSVENSTTATEMIDNLAYNMELCQRTALLAGRGADKIMVFMHMTEFSMFNQPPMAVTKETLTILSVAFPESLGCMVILNPPPYFTMFWNIIYSLIDPKTRDKVFMLRGSITDGSPNDLLMRQVIGEDWKALTGAGRGVVAQGYSAKHKRLIDASPGFDIGTYWPSVMAREQAFATHLAQAAAAAETGRMSEVGEEAGAAVGASGSAAATALPSPPRKGLAAPLPWRPGRETEGPCADEAETAGKAGTTTHPPPPAVPAADAAALAPSLPAFLWLLDQENLWRAARTAPGRLFGEKGAAWGAAAELTLLLTVMLATTQAAAASVVRPTAAAAPMVDPAGATGRLMAAASAGASALASAGAFFAVASVLLERPGRVGGGGPAAGPAVLADSVVGALVLVRRWAPFLVGANATVLLARRL